MPTITGNTALAAINPCSYRGYDYDEETDAYVCTVGLDEDDMLRFLSGNTSGCHYYRYYDEYKSVHKQI